MRHASLVSAIALLACGAIGTASAQTYGEESGSNQKPKVTGEQGDLCAKNPDACQPRGKRKAQREENDDDGKMKRADNDWRFDSGRHERRRDKNERFRFFFGGFWYPEPYWLVRTGPRVSCGEGRAIMRDRGFRSVRTIECQGRTYTYLGRRDGRTFRVLLSARSGRVVDMDRV